MHLVYHGPFLSLCLGVASHLLKPECKVCILCTIMLMIESCWIFQIIDESWASMVMNGGAAVRGKRCILHIFSISHGQVVTPLIHYQLSFTIVCAPWKHCNIIKHCSFIQPKGPQQHFQQKHPNCKKQLLHNTAKNRVFSPPQVSGLSGARRLLATWFMASSSS